MAAMDAIYQQLMILLALATLSHFTIKRFRQPTIVVVMVLVSVVLSPLFRRSLAIGAEERRKAQALASTTAPSFVRRAGR